MTDASTFVAARAYNGNIHEGLSRIAPIAMSGTDDLAVVTPCVREGVSSTHIVAIESEPVGLAGKMFTEERLICLTMNFARDFIGHKPTPETRARKGFPNAADRAESH